MGAKMTDTESSEPPLRALIKALAALASPAVTHDQRNEALRVARDILRCARELPEPALDSRLRGDESVTMSSVLKLFVGG